MGHIKKNERQLNQWFGSLSFEEMEKITRYDQYQFNPEDGYQKFIDVCEDWWKNQSLEEKYELYKEYNYM